ncbi:PREDICTED: arylsulfatase B-like isoform X1 [Wasmannia auropunctata]|uniref:arylsulfatase B-like isoform X1 n=2 Tax=Wasmannia auropunctata TaxID=64793 RepID=UPI0005EEFB22|nr:PREDICTED: arylsulfatase B-like isoform X1 [Wasmannia auropunctata]
MLSLCHIYLYKFRNVYLALCSIKPNAKPNDRSNCRTLSLPLPGYDDYRTIPRDIVRIGRNFGESSNCAEAMVKVMNIKYCVSFTVVLIVLNVFLYFTLAYVSVKPPNIVVIIADDLGWNDVSFHGADEIPTPNIDALAYNGVILNRHYVMPICTPSRTAFLTGRYPIRTGMQGYPLRGAEPRGIPLNHTLLPEYLRRLGYTTHLIGKWHVGYHTRNFGPTRRGFDTFFGYFTGFIQYFNHTLYESENLGYDLHRIVGDNHTVEYRYDYMTDLISDEAESIISSHNTDKSLYLQLAHLAPHSSDAKEIMEVRNWKETNATLGYIKDLNRRKYASVVATMDKSVGRVVDALKRRDMLKNTIIIFMADNGAQTEGYLANYGSNYPLRGLKLSLFEGGVRGAACVYSPLIDHSSRVSTHLFHIADWLPTLYSAAGGNSSDLKQLDGIDQWSAIKRVKSAERRSILLNIMQEENEAAIMERYKLVRDKSDYQKHYNYYSGNNVSYPKYNVTNVLTSPAALAIASVSARVLNAPKIKELRREATIVCEDTTNSSSCANRTCLFDIYKDPCEITDLSSKHPTVVERLNVFIDSYKSVLVKESNKPVDPAGLPYHFNNTWMPWLPDDYQPISEMHLTTMGEVTLQP